MRSPFEAPTFEALRLEQALVQSGKFNGRLLQEYGRYLFPGQGSLKTRSSAVADLVRPFCDESVVSIRSLVSGLHQRTGATVHWADMGGGRGLAMRQLLAALPEGSVEATNVDLFHVELEGLMPEERHYLEELAPGMTDHPAAPQYIEADVETVILPRQADIITSVQVMQYLNNPLAAISNWYNQLADDGLLMIAASHDWSSWIRYETESDKDTSGEYPTQGFITALGSAGIVHAFTDDADWSRDVRPLPDASRFRSLIVQKRPGTELIVDSAVASVWVNPEDYKVVYYERPDNESFPVVVGELAKNL